MFADLPDLKADTHITPQPLDGVSPRAKPEEPAAGSAAPPKPAPQPA
jgi:hypothetical protein